MDIKEIEFLDTEKLKHAYDGSYYTLVGTGGPLETWVSGYEDLLEQAEIGTPTRWFQTNGGAVNAYASISLPQNRFPSDLTFLLFPLHDLVMGRLAMFKLQYEDRWFDDVIDNMRRRIV